MTIRHLKVFIEVVDNGGIGKAAEKVFTSQPAVSQTIAELENYYGIKLFERLNRKLFITDDGKKLLDYARHITSSFDEMEQNIGNFKNSKLLRIGATVTIGTCLLPKLLKKFENENVEVLIDNTESIEKLILESKIDLGLIEGNVVSRDIVKIPFFEDEIIFVSDSKERNKNTFILREKGSGTRELIERELKRTEFKTQNVWTISNTEAIKNAVLNGLGITAISKLLVEKEIENGSLIKIMSDRKIKRNFVLAYHKNKFQNKFFLEFVNLVYAIK